MYLLTTPATSSSNRPGTGATTGTQVRGGRERRRRRVTLGRDTHEQRHMEFWYPAAGQLDLTVLGVAPVPAPGRRPGGTAGSGQQPPCGSTRRRVARPAAVHITSRLDDARNNDNVISIEFSTAGGMQAMAGRLGVPGHTSGPTGAIPRLDRGRGTLGADFTSTSLGTARSPSRAPARASSPSGRMDRRLLVLRLLGRSRRLLQLGPDPRRAHQARHLPRPASRSPRSRRRPTPAAAATAATTPTPIRLPPPVRSPGRRWPPRTSPAWSR